MANEDLQCACRAAHMSPVYSSTSEHELTRFEGYQAQFANHQTQEAFIHQNQRNWLSVYSCNAVTAATSIIAARVRHVRKCLLSSSQDGQCPTRSAEQNHGRLHCLILGLARPGRLQQGRRTWATCARMRCLAVPCIPSLKTTAHTQKLRSSHCEYTGVV